MKRINNLCLKFDSRSWGKLRYSNNNVLFWIIEKDYKTYLK